MKYLKKFNEDNNSKIDQFIEKYNKLVEEDPISGDHINKDVTLKSIELCNELDISSEDMQNIINTYVNSYKGDPINKSILGHLKSKLLRKEGKSTIKNTDKIENDDIKSKLLLIAQNYLGMTPKDKGCTNWSEMQNKMADEIIKITQI